jgi:serine/threonine protein kinase
MNLRWLKPRHTPYVGEPLAGDAVGSLAQQLATRALARRVSAELVETLARAVQAAHQRGFIHRNLKPANIINRPAPVGAVFASLPHHS